MRRNQSESHEVIQDTARARSAASSVAKSRKASPIQMKAAVGMTRIQARPAIRAAKRPNGMRMPAPRMTQVRIRRHGSGSEGSRTSRSQM